MPAPFPQGEVLNGAWRLERVLGQGGMGTVYEAIELQLGRKVAVKVLHRSEREEDHERFDREARMMARIDHPNVVPLYAFGRHREVPFIVMRLLEGVRFNVVLRENSGRLSWRQWRPLLMQLCDALEHIHQRQMVHRDLKPSNIFVSPTGWLTLLDMGLTRGWKTALTRTGMVWGTPEYISPEQALGERALDGRADLYSVAVLSYLALSGELPFFHESSQKLLELHLHAPRPDVTRVAPGLPRAFGALLMRAMAIDPDERPATVRELLELFDRAFDGQTEPAAVAPKARAPAASPPGPPIARASAPRASVATRPDSPRASAPAPAAPRASGPRPRPGDAQDSPTELHTTPSKKKR